jgi:hypothetical protein
VDAAGDSRKATVSGSHPSFTLHGPRNEIAT